MSDMTLKVEFLAGTAIEEAIQQASSLAKKLDLAFVSFTFNGIDCSISSKAIVKEMVSKFHTTIRSENKFICG